MYFHLIPTLPLLLRIIYLNIPKIFRFRQAFARNAYTINVNADGDGLVNGQSTLILVPVFEDLVELNATASTGWEFNRWYGYPFPTLSLKMFFFRQQQSRFERILSKKTIPLSSELSPFGESNGSGTYSYEANASISSYPQHWICISQAGLGTLQLLLTDLNSYYYLCYHSLTARFQCDPYLHSQAFIRLHVNSSDSNGTVYWRWQLPLRNHSPILFRTRKRPANPVNAPAGYTLASWSITDQAGQVSLSSEQSTRHSMVDGNYSIFANFEPVHCCNCTI